MEGEMKQYGWCKKQYLVNLQVQFQQLQNLSFYANTRNPKFFLKFDGLNFVDDVMLIESSRIILYVLLNVTKNNVFPQ